LTESLTEQTKLNSVRAQIEIWLGDLHCGTGVGVSLSSRYLLGTPPRCRLALEVDRYARSAALVLK
jgi:hypothetical protein